MLSTIVFWFLANYNLNSETFFRILAASCDSLSEILHSFNYVNVWQVSNITPKCNKWRWKEIKHTSFPSGILQDQKVRTTAITWMKEDRTFSIWKHEFLEKHKDCNSLVNLFYFVYKQTAGDASIVGLQKKIQ